MIGFIEEHIPIDDIVDKRIVYLIIKKNRTHGLLP